MLGFNDIYLTRSNLIYVLLKCGMVIMRYKAIQYVFPYLRDLILSHMSNVALGFNRWALLMRKNASQKGFWGSEVVQFDITFLDFTP